MTFDIAIDAFESFVWGDVTDDGIVDGDDLIEIYWYSLGATGGNLALMGRGDIDADGDVDVLDGFGVHSFIEGITAPLFRVGEIGAVPTVLSGPTTPVTTTPALISRDR